MFSCVHFANVSWTSTSEKRCLAKVTQNFAQTPPSELPGPGNIFKMYASGIVTLFGPIAVIMVQKARYHGEGSIAEGSTAEGSTFWIWLVVERLIFSSSNELLASMFACFRVVLRPVLKSDLVNMRTRRACKNGLS